MKTKDIKIIAVIPARLDSVRFPKKMLKDLAGKPLIVRTYEAVKNTQLFDEVCVATDSEEIKELVEKAGGKVFMSLQRHESGSDRIAEAVKEQPVDVVVNIQGDEPFVSKETLEKLIEVFYEDTHHQIDVASVMSKIKDVDEINNPNVVKVVCDEQQLALYFSRATIPFNREQTAGVDYFKHIGIYAFRKHALMAFTNWEMGTLEKIEKLEQLRYLENGKRIKMVETQSVGIGIDTPEDLEKARKKF